MRSFRPNASQELVMGYVEAALMAEERRLQAQRAGDRVEEREWRKVATSLWYQAEFGMVDAPESRVNYYQYDDTRQVPQIIVQSLTDLEDSEHPTTGIDGGESGCTKVQQLAVAAVTGVLSPGQRSAYVHVEGEKVKRRDVADLSGLSIETIDVHLREGRRKLRRIMRASALLH